MCEIRIIPPPGRVPFQPKIDPCGSGIPAAVHPQVGNLGNGLLPLPSTDATSKWCHTHEANEPNRGGLTHPRETVD
ncbi:hypothetical protein GCM10007923_09390 [Shinella yambaruensis]|uniref:Uncharacterized protein n=1 Tax=Shinella yambaruensis TaxID=415996 RepID=A0ABQ5ZG52_9HYPH|nr:hypothetical protein GCM10007923_09390 [Shinella yambaruensis]